MEKINKKELRSTTEEALNQLLTKLHIAKPSKKTRRVIAKASRRISKRLKTEVRQQLKGMRKQFKKDQKASRKVKGRKESAAA